MLLVVKGVGKIGFYQQAGAGHCLRWVQRRPASSLHPTGDQASGLAPERWLNRKIDSRPSALTKCITPVYTYLSGRWSYLLPLAKS
jgi:hypothetical protein